MQKKRRSVDWEVMRSCWSCVRMPEDAASACDVCANESLVIWPTASDHWSLWWVRVVNSWWKWRLLVLCFVFCYLVLLHLDHEICITVTDALTVVETLCDSVTEWVNRLQRMCPSRLIGVRIIVICLLLSPNPITQTSPWRRRQARDITTTRHGQVRLSCRVVLVPKFHLNDSNGIVADLSRDFFEPSQHVAVVWNPETSPAVTSPFHGPRPRLPRDKSPTSPRHPHDTCHGDVAGKSA